MATEFVRVTVEDVFGDDGFRVRWSVKDHWADVEVYKIAAYDTRDILIPCFRKKGWKCSNELVLAIGEAEEYLTGFVKWDGCTELDMGKPH